MSGARQASPSVLSVRDLSVTFRHETGETRAVAGVSFTVGAGETLAIVGESGSGKSVTALGILGLLPRSADVAVGGSARLGEEELVGASERSLRQVRGNRIAMIFQEPMTALNPLHRVERQIAETLALHRGLEGAAAAARIDALLREVALVDAEGSTARIRRSFPHELSGGQRQRAMIAMALANEPEILIADEPTTALDVTVQEEILGLLARIRRERGMALILITHDLAIVRRTADRVVVMRRGEMMETGSADEIFRAPRNDYTRMLIASRPRGLPDPVPAGAAPLLTVRDLAVRYPVKGGLLRRVVSHVEAAVGVNFTLRPGETLGLVGESGSGKSSVAAALVRLTTAEGVVDFAGTDLAKLDQKRLRPLRNRFQIVFQDPFGALSPRMTVGDIVAEGLDVHAPIADRAARRDRIGAALAEVGLDAAMQDRFPHEFSGGQRQRIAIARALILEPELIVLDEPTSALDVSIQAQIVELLRGLQRRRQLAYVLISHDLAVVRALAHKLIVLRQGRVMEQGEAASVMASPETDYTRALIRAAFPDGLS
ncbi:ABC transporter ATP-binding protein [Tistrella mobilis]|uniref:ATP-binding component of ABC transporter n=2 Tax=Tistrella mobilis TaxID=171437 RepID=I3TQI5_TISMK|nr:ABC transporter ATP-binding protein [Tistrella mobilis]AFK55023.1 putative ATP-binding component of ABC transporter [Tistrella mobilis KA081020-065]